VDAVVRACAESPRLAVDDTSFPKQGRHSLGVQRQYCGALGRIANCQVAVSTVLLDHLAWSLSFELYLPQAWCTDAPRRTKAHFRGVRFREKWRIALANRWTPVIRSGSH
jgi:SRSO17 transposase